MSTPPKVQDDTLAVEMEDKAATFPGTEFEGPVIDPKRERAVVLKPDLFLGPVIVLPQPISNIDRGNIGYANTQGPSKDFRLTGKEVQCQKKANPSLVDFA
jgi:hypothetical protein